MNKKIINVMSDDVHTCIEYEDHTIQVLMSVEQFFNFLVNNEYIINKEKKCIYCGVNDKQLCTLNNNDYICQSCTEKLLEVFAESGAAISLNLSKFNPQAVKQLKKFLMGGGVNKATFQIKEDVAEEANNKEKVNTGSIDKLANIINKSAHTIKTSMKFKKKKVNK